MLTIWTLVSRSCGERQASIDSELFDRILRRERSFFCRRAKPALRAILGQIHGLASHEMVGNLDSISYNLFQSERKISEKSHDKYTGYRGRYLFSISLKSIGCTFMHLCTI